MEGRRVHAERPCHLTSGLPLDTEPEGVLHVEVDLGADLRAQGNRDLESAAGLIAKAHEHATPMERRSLGHCYEIGYSEPSEVMHFSPLSERELELDDLRFTSIQGVFLCTSIITRAQELMGITRETPACQRARLAASMGGPGGIRGHADVGDFVVVVLDDEPFLAEVLEVQTRFGNESCRVRYLVERPDGLEEDSVLPKHVPPNLRIDRNDMRSRINAQFGGLFSGDELRSLQEIPANELQDSLRRAMVTVWNLRYGS